MKESKKNIIEKRNHNNNLEIKKRYKMYKAKKRWIVVPILFLGISGMVSSGETKVLANEEVPTFSQLPNSSNNNKENRNTKTEVVIKRVDGLYHESKNLVFYIPGLNISRLKEIWLSIEGKELIWQIFKEVGEDLYEVALTNEGNFLNDVANSQNIGKTISFWLLFKDGYRSSTIETKIDSNKVSLAKEKYKKEIDKLNVG